MLAASANDVIEKRVHKHVAAIHCSGELSLFQRKIINCLLFHSYPKLKTQSRFEIKIRDLLNLMGLNNNDYRYLREAFKNIRKTDITWNLTSESFKQSQEPTEFEPWIDCSWLSWAMSDGSTIHYEFPEPLKAYLTEPSIYASISLIAQQKFSSKFALVLYENCLRYVNVGQTKIFDLKTFRNIMGVKEGQYKIFRDLNSRVIKPALKQINELTELDVEVVFKRASRRVVAMQFKVSYKPEQVPKKKLVNRKSVMDEIRPMNDADKSYYGFVENFKALSPSRQKLVLNGFEKRLREVLSENYNQELSDFISYYESNGWNNRPALEYLKHFCEKYHPDVV